jgi:hypothetical protein
MHPEFACLPVADELYTEILADSSQVRDAKALCDLSLRLIKKRSVIAPCQAIVDMPKETSSYKLASDAAAAAT